MTKENNKPELTKQQQNFINIIILVAIIGFALMVISKDNNPTRPSSKTVSKDCTDEIAHYSYAQMYISPRLKDPSSADYGSMDKTQFTTVGKCEFKITGVVRATNSFGGIVPQYFTIHTRYNAMEDNFSVGKLVME